MGKSQHFGFLLLELLCALSLFMLATVAAGGFLAQLMQCQKTVNERQVFLAGVTQLLETGAAGSTVVAMEVKKVRVNAVNKRFYLSAMQVQGAGSEQKLVVTQCMP